ncbi:MAG: FAD-dependent oxidoreductase [Phycisphaerales bacterium]
MIGVAAALELACRGRSVVVLERDRVGHGCSFGNAGWLTPSLARPLAAPGQARKALPWLLDPESPFYIKPRMSLSLASWLLGFLAAGRSQDRFVRSTKALVELSNWSVDAWEALAAQSDEPFGFARRGLIALYETRAELDAGIRLARISEPFGVPFEVWTADDVCRNEPAIRGPQAGAIYFPRDGQCEPDKAVAALARQAHRAGAVIIEDAEVLGAEVQGRTVQTLRTTRGQFRAGHVLLAVGAWSGSLGRAFQLRIPMLGAKGYSIILPRTEPHPLRSILLAERKIGINPHDDALRLAGTLELVGEDLSINMRRVHAIARGAAGMLAIADPAMQIRLWRGLRPCLPDGMPIIGRAGGFDNLWLATGHQMTGLKTGPATGRLIAELICDQTPSFDPAPFRAERYARRR